MITEYLIKDDLDADVKDLCSWAGLNRSVFYYQPTGGKGGANLSTHTNKQDGSRVSNDVVVEEIKRILSEEFITYGYDLTTTELKHLGYIINKKKVYGLMDRNNLL